MTARLKPTGIRGIHVAVAMVSFFAVIIALDALFITFAIRSHPGEQVKNSYVLGLEFNKEIEKQAQQRALGWSAQAGLSDDGSTLVVRLLDRDGAPLSGMSVAVQMHQAGVRLDGARVWLAERAPGEYAIASTLAGPARVEAAIAVSRGRERQPIFEATKTLVLS